MQDDDAHRNAVTIEILQKHVVDLCERDDIVLCWCKRISQACALRECEEIQVAPIKSVVSYAVALHEIGHVKGRHQTSSIVIVRERWAWKWARANALIWTNRMENCAIQSLDWYAARWQAPIKAFVFPGSLTSKS